MKAYDLDYEKFEINEEQYKALVHIFQKYDTTGEGKIQTKDFKKISRELEENFDQEEVNEAIQFLDKQKAGSILFSDFLHWWSTP